MFQLFLKARANNYFKARSARRDAESRSCRIYSSFGRRGPPSSRS